MSNLMTVSNQWATRPDDERFVSLYELQSKKRRMLSDSRVAVLPMSSMLSRIESHEDGLCIRGSHETYFSNWSFAQTCRIAGAPADYLRTLPATLVRDNLLASRAANSNQQFYLTDNMLRAVTSDTYGRIHDADVVSALVKLAGDGVGETNWRVPGEFGRIVPVTKDNTTIYAGDRDMFVFLCDETNRIEMPVTRENEKPRSLARGFYVRNSEVGAGALEIAMFLFDYVCSNRIIWGVSDFTKIRIRHNTNAPERMLAEARPAIEAMRTSAGSLEQDRLKAAQLKIVAKKPAKAVEWLVDKGFSNDKANRVLMQFAVDEQRECVSAWDMATAVTGYAKSVPFQDERVKLERLAGSWL